MIIDQQYWLCIYIVSLPHVFCLWLHFLGPLTRVKFSYLGLFVSKLLVVGHQNWTCLYIMRSTCQSVTCLLSLTSFSRFHCLGSRFHAYVYFSVTASGRSIILDVLIHYEDYMSVCHMSFVLDLIFTVHVSLSHVFCPWPHFHGPLTIVKFSCLGPFLSYYTW